MLPALSPQAQQSIQPVLNRFIQDEQGNPSTYPFPENIADETQHPEMNKETRQRIYQYLLKHYIWPQILERKQFEATWDKLLNMARATWKYSDMDVDQTTRLARKYQDSVLTKDPTNTDIGTKIDVADTVIFDAVDRLTNLNHFIAYKEEMPVRYEIPGDITLPHENEVYSPMSDLVKSANGWLRYNFLSQDIYRKGWMTAKAHYSYGVSFIHSEFLNRIDMIPRRMPDRSFKTLPELTDIGVSFEPLSIRKLWLNYRISVYKMDYQPCPFFFDLVPRFALNANQYNPTSNPMGLVNLASLASQAPQWLFGTTEMESLYNAWKATYPDSTTMSIGNLMEPEYNVEMLWTLYPMLPIQQNQQTGEIEFEFAKDQNGIEDHTQPIPLQRYIVQTFGGSLVAGQQEILRIQKNFYPRDTLPLYGSSHMPSLDDGTYSPAIGTILEGHYRQICRCLSQFLENKDWNNDPPVDILTGSPSMGRKGLNDKGARNPVNGPNDLTRRQPFDTGNTTLQFMQTAREQAQTSSKSTDAILGKAMGSRTSATEATNVFQTAMSGVTTDVNLFTHDIYGGYATRTWEYTGLWVDPDILQAITGSYGFAIKPEHLLIRLGLKWDTGSSFIESITRQNQIQYLLQAFPPGDTSCNRAYLLRELLTEYRFKNVDKIVNDQGKEKQSQIANEQAIMTYLGQMVLIDPDQDHALAIKVKKSYLQDRQSVWNTNPQTVNNGQALVQQIQTHSYWLQLQQMQMQLAQQRVMLGGDPNAMQPEPTGQAPLPSPGQSPSTGGQQRQQTGR